MSEWETFFVLETAHNNGWRDIECLSEHQYHFF